MYRIVTKEALKPTVILYEIEAPMVARKAQPGQFIILRVDENGERIPITIHDYNREKGTVTIIVQTVGATTEKLSHKQQGEYLHDFVGPLGKRLVTEALKQLLDEGNQYDEIFAIGPMVMMKFVCKTTAPYGVPTTVSMSPIMIDGTGMCGGCRLTVGGETKFACVDGPDFDGQQVDWDLAVKRNQMYHDFEVRKHEEVCNLFKQEVK